MFDVYDGGKGKLTGLLEPFYYIDIKAPNLGGRALFDDITECLEQVKELLEDGANLEIGTAEMTRKEYDALPNLD